MGQIFGLKKNRFPILCMVLLVFSINLRSQDYKKNTLSDSVIITKKYDRILTLNELAIEYWQKDLYKSIKYADEALSLEEKYEIFKPQARSLNIKGVSYYLMNNYDSAFFYYKSSIKSATKYEAHDDLFKALKNLTTLYYRGYEVDSLQLFADFSDYIDLTIKSNNHHQFYTGLYYIIGLSHYKKIDVLPLLTHLQKIISRVDIGADLKAVLYANEGYYYWLKLKRFEAVDKIEKAISLTNDNLIKVYCLINLGRINFENELYSDAEHFYQEALNLILENEDPTIKHLLYNIYAEFGALCLKRENFEKALYFLKEVEKSLYLFNDVDKAIFYNNIGVAFKSLDSLDKASLYLSSAISSFKKLELNNYLLGAYNSMAELYITKNDSDSLNFVIGNICILVKEVNDYYILSDSYKILSEYYELSGQHKKTIECLKKLSVIADSLNSKEFAFITSSLHFKYSTNKKDQLIALQSKIINDNSITKIVLISSSLILIPVTTTLLLRRRVKSKQRKPKSRNIDKDLYRNIEICMNQFLESKLFTDPNINIESLAQKCHTNRSYLSYFIHEKYGLHFNAFINQLRIKEALNILSDNPKNFPLKELYIRLGYKSYSVFNDSFKNQVGITPAIYLKSTKQLQ